MVSSQQWNAIVSSASWGSLSLNWLWRVWDFIKGVLDTVTLGLTRTSFFQSLLGPLGNADESSSAYRWGTYAGQIINIVMYIVQPAGLAGMIFFGVQAAGSLATGIEAAMRGDYLTMALSFLGAGLVAARFLSACKFSQGIVNWLGNSSTGQVLSMAGSWGLRGLSAFGVVSGVVNGAKRIADGDTIGGILDMITAGVDLRNMLRACFTGETQILTKRGYVRFDQLQLDDEVASSPEADPHGPVEFKPIQAIFTNRMPIWHLHVDGKVIRTTAEHPFYVWGKGWMACQHLQPGDLLRSHDGLTATVEEVYETGEEETVYNCAVAEYHTYFVGGEEWRFAVWAHNSCVTDNAAKGKANAGKVNEQVKKTQTNVVEEVSIRPLDSSGKPVKYRVRVDDIGVDMTSGSIKLTDAKASDTASLTRRQRTGYPLIAENGGIVVGNNGGVNYPAGLRIPPTTVDIVRP